MSDKILPRNATAIDAAMIDTVFGNPVSSRLESGVGNCYPGLDLDIRNLERRFFPHLTVEIIISDNRLLISDVDIDGVNANNRITTEQKVTYRKLQTQLQSNSVPIVELSSNFKEFGELTWDGTSFIAPNSTPEPALTDIWTAIRLIPFDMPITLRFDLANERVELNANRAPYIDEETGALASSFSAGEMTQSLCQPWTYDFRDCGCWYWATNHPDTVQAEMPPGAQPNTVFDRPTNWARAQKVDPLDGGPPVDSATRQRTTREMGYYELANRWNELGIVLNGREQGDVYSPSKLVAAPNPLPRDRVHDFIRYAAAVEHSVMTEYLSAAYSLNPNASQNVSDDVFATYNEVLRVAYGEMRHMRLANDLLRLWCEVEGLPFEPVLAHAAELPAGGGNSRPVEFRSLNEATLDDFINIERPSFSVDGLYTRLLDSMRTYAPNLSPIVETIIAEGSEHFETFLYIKEWLMGHQENQYLLSLQQPNNSDAEYVELRTQYHNVLSMLYTAYSKGMPAGAIEVNTARHDMVKQNGLSHVCRAVRDAGLKVMFEAPTNDPRFTPIQRPTI
ncbi:hypothetical protein HJ049_06415 [Vibrio parahaemolyticus]|nr:hypothetical protein [Vibrio parahaemolyticus]